MLAVTDKGSMKKYEVQGENGYGNLVELLLSEGYEKIAEKEGKMEIYRKE